MKKVCVCVRERESVYARKKQVYTHSFSITLLLTGVSPV